jgi:hypothetical protein
MYIRFSKAAETRKKTAYAPAKAREETRWRRKIRSIPLAFEISGGWGEDMAKFFEECVRLKKRRKSAEKYHWCAIPIVKVVDMFDYSFTIYHPSRAHTGRHAPHISARAIKYQ